MPTPSENRPQGASSVEKILKKLKPSYKTITGQAAKEAKARLIVKKSADPWHRDGLVFQAISWIAAHQASKAKSRSRLQRLTAPQMSTTKSHPLRFEIRCWRCARTRANPQN